MNIKIFYGNSWFSFLSALNFVLVSHCVLLSVTSVLNGNIASSDLLPICRLEYISIYLYVFKKSRIKKSVEKIK